MSSGFVSSGKIEGHDPSTAQSSEASSMPLISHAKGTLGKNQDAWDQVQREVNAEREQRAAERAKAINGEEKSLYEVLQANKAAKQAAFEEQNRLGNQFRTLDDDDIDFLDRVREAKRIEDDRLRQETKAGLQAFRDAQKVTDKDLEKAASDEELGENEWAIGRKKRKSKAPLARSVKRRTGDDASTGKVPSAPETDTFAPRPPSSTTPPLAVAANSEQGEPVTKEPPETNKPSISTKPKPPPEKPALMSLVDYGSDSE
ncbi:hypothetical protein BROUX41_002307 [Berkeleyomyces rouxiae]|uniref:uncharacterized protein n=1 Tax=Berkeleyomyces rouxiae TaxID=2035830 RepID=UPI003B7BE607